jgi:hypothetical protein
MTIALNFSISRDTITEISREIREINLSVNSTSDDLIRTHIRTIMFNIETFRDNSIEILRDLIISNSSFLRVRELNKSIMILDIFRKS